MTRSLLLVGVGGQGIILASKILVSGLMKIGYDVKMSEIHGMAQRGGSVTTQIKFGDKVHSPCIVENSADILVAFEKIEAVRWLDKLKKGGALLVNDYEIYSLPVLIGKEEYPKNVVEKLQDQVENCKVFDAHKVAEELGNVLTQNIVILGALIKVLAIDSIDWTEVLRENLPPKLHEINEKALKLGMEL